MFDPFGYFRKWRQVEEDSPLPPPLSGSAPVPCLWLMGKTGSGKTSIVRYLTGAHDAEIGRGFRPQTRQSQTFDFPDDDFPIVRFLDTRGLGEVAYDASEDIARFDALAHLVVVTIRATDQATAAILEAVRSIRRVNPDRPLLLVITCLHDTYPGAQHPRPDPFGTETRPLPPDLLETTSRCLARHYERFEGLFDRAVPIDLTQTDDGFAQADFGGTRLKHAILDLLPRAYRQTLRQLDHVVDELRSAHRRRSSRTILAHAVVAASAAAVPVPWVDIPFVLATQSHLIHRLAADAHQTLDVQTLLNLTGGAGGRVAFKMGTRELLKLIPWVGVAVNAAAAFAFTFASGEAASWYFREVRAGHIPSADTLQEVYREQLRAGASLWRATRETSDP